MNFWQTLPPGFTCLAPMEGVADIVFRSVVAHAARPDVFFTEFTNVSSFASEKGRSNALERLAIVPTDAPIIAQLWGTNVENFAFTAKNLPKGFSGLDINMGCPDKHVVRNGGGSALIKTPELARSLISAAKTSSLPVSVKTRLGYSRPEEYQDWLATLLSEDIAALSVHLRTKKEMSKVPAHYELIPNIIRLRDQIAPNTVLIFNGDFLSRTHFNQVLADQGIKDPSPFGCMIGRGIFANPFCFEPTPHEHSREELTSLLNYHLNLFDAHWNAPASPAQPSASPLNVAEKESQKSVSRNTIPFEPLKRFFKIYINNFPGSHDLRARLMETKTTTEVRDIIANT